jgi:hypothetical protein
MKKSLIALLVLALVAPTMAATIVDVAGGEGQITVTITVSDDDVVRGVAIAVEQADGDLGDMKLVAGSDVAAPAFNTYIDWAVSNASGYEVGDGHPAAKIGAAGAIDDDLPAAAFAVSAGYLDQSEQQGGLGAGVYTITIALDGDADTYFDVSLDTLRGGIVGDNLEVTDNTTQVLVTADVTPPVCLGDFNGDGAISGADVNGFIATFGKVEGDVGYNMLGDFNGDGAVSGADVNGFIAVFGTICP